jgi:hypothetical protein
MGVSSAGRAQRSNATISRWHNVEYSAAGELSLPADAKVAVVVAAVHSGVGLAVKHAQITDIAVLL